MAVNILVVDDDLNIQRVLAFALKQEGFEVQVASAGAAGVELARSSTPDVILMDAGLPDLDGYEAVSRIRAAEESGRRVPILMLTAEGDVGQRVKGLRAGADDDIVKPFHPAELVARIRALLARSGTAIATGPGVETMGRLATFYGAKGGVGTTTIAINAGIALVREAHRRTALIDANLQFGDLRVFLDLKLDAPSVLEAVNEPELDADLLRKLVVKHPSGLDLLLAPTSPEAADLVLEKQRQDPNTLRHLLGLFRELYDYTLVDMGKAIDDFNLQLFDAADMIFVVMTADLSCLKNVQLVLKTMDNLGYERSKVQLVLNRSTAFTGINVKNAESVLGHKIDHEIINEYRGAISALNSGAPFMSSRPEAPLSLSVAAFAAGMDAQAAAEFAAARA